MREKGSASVYFLQETKTDNGIMEEKARRDLRVRLVLCSKAV